MTMVYFGRQTGMAGKVQDRIGESVGNSGQAAVGVAIALAGALESLQSFSAGFDLAGAAKTDIPVVLSSGQEWQTGKATFDDAANTLTFTTIERSSNADNPIDFDTASEVRSTPTANTDPYCRTNPARDLVEEGPKPLPAIYGDARNFNDDAVWTDSERLALYWYPYTLLDPGAPGLYYLREVGPFVIGASAVTQTVTYTQWDIEDVRSLKNRELLEHLPDYSTAALALDSLLKEDVVNTQEWISNRQMELARLDDWQQVADFDTTKPLVIPISENSKAIAYQRQAAELTALNQGAIASGSAAPYDQVALDALVSANQPAADDLSGGTASVSPDWKTRQAIAKAGEKSSIVWIYRNEAQDTYFMVLTNREPGDTRPIYIFSYTTNGTPVYLTWRVFEEQPDGTWRLESTAPEAQYVPGDLQFIFSYIANPAVESEYFTEPVYFPAGLNQMQIYVRWDAE